MSDPQHEAGRELIFDANFGELFILHVAGNVVSPEVMGSLGAPNWWELSMRLPPFAYDFWTIRLPRRCGFAPKSFIFLLLSYRSRPRW
jgi:hypothetical protein